MIPAKFLDDKMIFHFNPTDAFEIGGPKVDSHILHSELGWGEGGKEEKEIEESGRRGGEKREAGRERGKERKRHAASSHNYNTIMCIG